MSRRIGRAPYMVRIRNAGLRERCINARRERDGITAGTKV